MTVLSELPPGPETLLLRLLGRGATFRKALAELAALPPGAWVRRVAGPILTRLRFAVQAAQLEGVTMSDEEAALMAAGDRLYQEWEQRTLEQGLTQGREQVLSRQFTRRLGRASGEAEAWALRARLASLGAERLSDVVLELEGDALAGWLSDPDAT